MYSSGGPGKAAKTRSAPIGHSQVQPLFSMAWESFLRSYPWARLDMDPYLFPGS